MATQRDLAARLGISQSLVSLALRGSRRVSADMRMQVQRAAVELGYLPDPGAAGLSERRWAGRLRPGCHALAWVGGRGRGRDDPYLPSIRERVRALGYTLVELWADDHADDAGLAAAISCRRVGGVLLGEGSRTPVELDWTPYAVIQCGLRSGGTPLPAVRHHVETLVPTAVERLRGLGHRRVAVLMCCTPGTLLSELVLEGWHRLCRQRLDGLTGRICPWRQVREGVRWLAGCRADVVLVNDARVARQLRAAGHAGPVACFGGDGQDPAWAGLDLGYAAVGRMAVDQLDGLVRRGSRGLPTELSTLLVEPVWHDGVSLRGP